MRLCGSTNPPSRHPHETHRFPYTKIWISCDIYWSDHWGFHRYYLRCELESLWRISMDCFPAIQRRYEDAKEILHISGENSTICTASGINILE